MKKSLFLLFAAGMALASCTTNEDVLETRELSDLSFGTFVDKATKAPITTLEENGKAFKVWGYYVGATNGDWTAPNVLWADGETVTRTDGAWGYTNTKQWIPNSQYRFYAIAPATVAATCTQGTADATGTITVTDFESDLDTDLVVATRYDRNTTSFDNSPINLTFRHVLSKVNVKFNTTSAYDIKLTDVMLSGFLIKGTGVFAPELIGEGANVAAEWTGAGNRYAIGGSLNTDPLPLTNNELPFISHQSKLMIPQTFTAENPLTLSIKYTVDGVGDQMAEDKTVFTRSLPITGTWESGHNITYLVTINTGNGNGDGADITFGVTSVVNWTDDTATPGSIK